jgi:Tfp pilus assembly protein PilO
VQVLREEVDRNRRATEALRSRAEAMRSNRSDVERFYARLGDKASLGRVREEISTLAHELGLKGSALTYTPEEVKGSEGVSQFQVRMEVSGTYRQLAAFLDRMERSPYFVTVDQISLRKRDASGGAGLEIALSAYYRAPGAAAAEESR